MKTGRNDLRIVYNNFLKSESRLHVTAVLYTYKQSIGREDSSH
jgi:hypothetical protein